MQMNHPYLLSWLEVARIALRDPHFLKLACGDNPDEEAKNLRDVLENFLREEQ